MAGARFLCSFLLVATACSAAAAGFKGADLESSILQAVGEAHPARSFVDFAQRHGKTYKTAEEIKLRFDNYRENLKLIRSTNQKGLPYTLAVNQYADWSWEEFKTHRLGAAQNCSAATKGSHKLTDDVLTDDVLPETKDWREKGIVSLVKDQGVCGSCWSFRCHDAGVLVTSNLHFCTATGALEAAYHQAHGKGITLSEQQLVDCATDFNNHGCKGGLPSQAFEYIKYNGGLETEQAYPYTAVTGTCKFSARRVAVRVVDSVNISMGAEDELKHAVAMVRPVSVAFQATDGFRLYESGVFTNNTCGSTSMDVNHAVLAVGYGVENGVPYWLIKNSWGESWGDKGYGKVEMGKNMCGIATCASYPIVA